MRFIRFDSVGGGSGDMILAALAGLGVECGAIRDDLKSVLPDPFELVIEKTGSHGLHGERMTVALDEAPENHEHGSGERASGGHHHEGPGEGHHEEHHHKHGGDPHGHSHEHRHNGHGGDSHAHFHRTFTDIRSMIAQSALDEKIKESATAIFHLLAEAEGSVHGRPVDEVAFHEVGAADSIVDIVGSAIGFHRLGVEQIAVGPLPVGFGTVKCAHGIFPVPAPATVELIRRGHLEILPDGEPCEMLTPTAAAIFSYWPKISGGLNYRVLKTSNAFGHRPMKDRPNLLRASLCETIETGENAEEGDGFDETLLILECNLDDISGEIAAAAARACFDAGALDVWMTPIMMKKGRCGETLSALIRPELRQAMTETIFRRTGTFGVRETTVRRRALTRRFETVETKYGPVKIKIGELNGGEIIAVPEFDDAQTAAERHAVSVAEVFDEAKSAYRRLRAD